jgi:plastocyanin
MTMVTVTVKGFKFVSADGSNELTVPSGTQVTFDFREANHTVLTEQGDAINADPININNGGGDTDAVSPVPQTRVVTITGNSGGEIRYQCGIHGPGMKGIIHISQDVQPPATVTVDNFAFEPNELTVPSGAQVTFDFREDNHTVMTVSSTNADPININNGGGDTDAVSPVPQTRVVTITGNSGGEIRYQCGIHGSMMPGVIHISQDVQPPATVTVDHFAFEPNDLTVPSGTEVTFDFQEDNHTVVTDSSTNADPISINNGGGDTDAVSPVPQITVVTITGNSGGEIRYHCGIHGSMMDGVIHIS